MSYNRNPKPPYPPQYRLQMVELVAKPLWQVTHQGVPVRVIHSKHPKTSCTPRRDGLCKAALTGLDTLPSCISDGVAFFCNFAG